MPTLLVMRLHSSEAIPVEDFEGYLDDLSIEAYELSFNDPTGTNGDPVGTEALIGTAAYIAPTLPGTSSPDPNDLPPEHDPDNRITQHFDIIDPLPPSTTFRRVMFSVATAVIEIPDRPVGSEHDEADIRLVISRDGSDIIHKQKYYNVPVESNPIPTDQNDFPGLAPSLHLALPSPGQQLNPRSRCPRTALPPILRICVMRLKRCSTQNRAIFLILPILRWPRHGMLLMRLPGIVRHFHCRTRIALWKTCIPVLTVLTVTWNETGRSLKVTC